MRQALFLILTLNALIVTAQGYLSFDNFSSSILRNEAGDNFGSGGMRMISAGYNLPLSAKLNDRGQATSWSAGLYAAYASLSNDIKANDLNPEDILNAGLNLTFITPLSKKWSILANVGCGVYAPTNCLRLKSVLGSGGVIFIYRLNDNLNLGIGGGVTNSYGAPMVMPMLYLSWQRDGKFALGIDMSNTIKISVSTILCDKLKVELVPMKIDGLTAIRTVAGKEQIYSMLMMQSYLSPSVQLCENFSVFVKVGCNWLRGISIRDRSLKSFFDSFKDDDGNDPYFRTSLMLSTGIRFNI